MKIKFGLGRRCINPELPISLAGYFNKRMWNTVLDDLEVRAVVLKSGGESAAIIQFDLLCINYKIYRSIEKLVKKADIKNISIKNLLICALKNKQIPEFHKMIVETDENAFIIFTNSEKIFGLGFYVYK